jgi:predicted AlkP superfamily pyrophosphatase or phosphodiesterase
MRQALGEMDSTLRSVLEGPLTDGASAVVFGDHGMVEVEFEIDLRATLAKLPVTLGKDFLYFLDSTQARLWFFDDRAREVILEALAGIEAGHVVTDAERRTLGIEFQDPRYGDEIFVLDGPGILHPSFFSKGSQGPRGMHGYLPAIRDNTTQVLAVGPGIRQGDLGTIPMTQIYQIINDVIVERRAGQTPA